MDALKTFARRLVTSRAHRDSVVRRAKAGTLPPDAEALNLEPADDRTPIRLDVRARRSAPVAPPSAQGVSRAAGTGSAGDPRVGR